MSNPSPRIASSTKHLRTPTLDFKAIRTPNNPQSVTSFSARSRPSDLLERVVLARKSRGSELVTDTSISKTIRIKPLNMSPERRITGNDDYMYMLDIEKLHAEPAESSHRGSFMNTKKILGTLHDEMVEKQFHLSRNKSISSTKNRLSSQVGLEHFHVERRERKASIEEFLPSMRELAEVKSILNQEYDEQLNRLIHDVNIKDFINVQKQRFNNTLMLLDKGFGQKANKEHNAVSQELWKLIFTELNCIRMMYENFLGVLNPDIHDKKTRSVFDEDIWKALKFIIDQSSTYRNSRNNKSKEKELDKLRQALLNYKLNFKSQKNYDVQAVKVYEMVENHINYLNQVIDNDQENLESLMIQHRKLLQGYQELEGKNNYIKDDVLKAIEDMKETRKAKAEVGLPIFQQKYLQTLVKELQTKNDKLTHEVDELKQIVAANREKLTYFKKSQTLKSKGACDKGVMVNFNSAAPQEPTAFKLSAYFNITSFPTKGNLLPRKITYAIINMIYSDKMISDMADDIDRRPRKALGDYAHQWFLRRFGVYTFCEPMIQDFVFTICAHNQILEARYKMFRDLLGIKDSEDIDPFDVGLDKDMTLDKKKIKQACYKTSQALSHLFRMLNMIRTSPHNRTPQSIRATLYGPLLPFSDEDDCMVNMDTANHIIKMTMQNDNFSVEETTLVEEHFQLIQQHDLYKRLAAKQKNNNEIDETAIELYIMGVDMFLKFMVDVVISKNIKEIDKCYALFRVNMASMNEVNVTYEEFTNAAKKAVPAASYSWKERSFTRLLDEVSAGKAPLHNLMSNFVHSYFDEERVKESEFKEIRDTKDITKEAKEVKQKDVQSPSHEEKSPTRKLGAKNKYEKAKKKEAQTQDLFDLGHPSANEKSYEIYDAVSSLILLQELYGMLKPNIVSLEKSHERLLYLHDEFGTELEDLLGDLNSMTAESLAAYGKKELVCFLETLWERFRQILSCLYKSK